MNPCTLSGGPRSGPQSKGAAFHLALLFLLLACGRTVVYPRDPPPCIFDTDCPTGLRCVNALCRTRENADAGVPVHSKRFAEQCGAGRECQSELCIGGPATRFCTQRCDGGCPTGFECKQSPDAGDVCAFPQPLLCQNCTRDEDCGATGADRCLSGFCGRDCTHAPCPQEYVCTPDRQCAPAGKTCDCTAETLGLAKSCNQKNDAGTCFGHQLCQPDAGFTTCTARTPLGETCNGLDDDCDDLIDDLRTACSTTNAAGTCQGQLRCTDAGVACDAPMATAERCDYLDDDCDGLTDEGFANDAGRYVLSAQNCGGCGNDCLMALPHATLADCVLSAGAATCRATACETGFVLAGGACLPAVDNLCQQCTRDTDCAGLGSACVTQGFERFCGRDCSTAACPAGYACRSWDGGVQCMPTAATCLCTAAILGAVRSCTKSTCRGYQHCTVDGGAMPAWDTCDVESYNVEICNAIDDDCDGQLDEGYRNAGNGKYEQPAHCGFCNNDCSKIWSPVLQHVSGVCDTAPSFPLCVMGPCIQETDGGEWVDVNRDVRDGCECARRQGNTTVDLPDRTGAAGYLDENCDGIDGVISDALFVWEGGSAFGTGTRQNPFATLGAAIGAFAASGRHTILVAEGTYRENVLLLPGVQLFGGYAVGFGARNPLLHQSLIAGQAPPTMASAPIAAVHLENPAPAAQETVVAGFTIRGFDAPSMSASDTDGVASIAVFLRGTDATVLFSDDDIAAGRGGAGGRGSTGIGGAGSQTSGALNGGAGLNSSEGGFACPSGSTRLGGAGGTNASCPGANAVRGGTTVCPFVNFTNPLVPIPNEQQFPADAGGLNGPGGWDWAFRVQAACFNVFTLGNDHDGRDGLAGPDGVAGAGGVGASDAARFGSIAGGRWVVSPLAASLGLSGSPGLAGGGGGAGGGIVREPGTPCLTWSMGASGGGGAAGGCGGSGGRAGGAGGASLGVLIIGGSPRVENNRIARSFAGAGGNGGFGGAGGLGGLGGLGGRNVSLIHSIGGKGGEGGNGGLGGGGGGGAGGPSFGVLAIGVDAAAWLAANRFVVAAPTGGKGGEGGSSAGAGSTGTPGANGASGDVFALFPCSLGCPTGTCDSNGLCIPP